MQEILFQPYPLIIPCHRVIKSDGTLGAYAGKMDGKKKRLIEMERFIITALTNLPRKACLPVGRAKRP